MTTVSSPTAAIADSSLGDAADMMRLAPAWVPRSSCVPGRRIKLHPHDYFALGGDRGGIDGRWLSSTTRAGNGPLTGSNEGLSMVVDGAGRLLPLDEVVDHPGSALIGSRLREAFGGWSMYSEFFDNQGPLPFHVHHTDEMAACVGRKGKPEAYFYPPQLNNHLGDVPYTVNNRGTRGDHVVAPAGHDEMTLGVM